uniref:Uncharacterized protein n=1 Tax=Parascaris univalens TaxID=6257 RepID=A0A915CJN2_PARUN
MIIFSTGVTTSDLRIMSQQRLPENREMRSSFQPSDGDRRHWCNRIGGRHRRSSESEVSNDAGSRPRGRHAFFEDSIGFSDGIIQRRTVMNHECHYHDIPHRRSYAHDSQQWQYRMGESIASIRRSNDENILTRPDQSEEEDINSSNGACIISGDFGSYDEDPEFQTNRPDMIDSEGSVQRREVGRNLSRGRGVIVLHLFVLFYSSCSYLLSDGAVGCKAVWPLLLQGLLA